MRKRDSPLQNLKEGHLRCQLRVRVIGVLEGWITPSYGFSRGACTQGANSFLPNGVIVSCMRE